jgi:hypothetical protein
MGLGDRVNDWQACGLMQVAGGEGVAAGLFIFDFYSAAAGLTGRFTFKGGGIGIGGNASGTVVPSQIGPFGPWSSVDCDTPFSIWDLNGAWGRITSASVGMGLEFGVVFITAAPPWSMFNSFFHSQNVGGFSTGAGAGAIALVGNWRFKMVVNNSPSSVSSGSGTMA